MNGQSDEPPASRRPPMPARHGYSPRYLAAKHRISVGQARDLIAEVGSDRERLDRAARAVRAAMDW